MINHYYPVDPSCIDYVFVWDGDKPLYGSAIGMNRETFDRFLIRSTDWLRVRGDTVRVRAAA
jgi:hypothetical protein